MTQPVLYEKLAATLARCARDTGYRDRLVRDPNATLKADGVDIGAAKIKMDWIETTNCMNVSVENGGANWNGALLLNIRK
jgi:hypothetical protein